MRQFSHRKLAGVEMIRNLFDRALVRVSFEKRCMECQSFHHSLILAENIISGQKICQPIKWSKKPRRDWATSRRSRSDLNSSSEVLSMDSDPILSAIFHIFQPQDHACRGDCVWNALSTVGFYFLTDNRCPLVQASSSSLIRQPSSTNERKKPSRKPFDLQDVWQVLGPNMKAGYWEHMGLMALVSRLFKTKGPSIVLNGIMKGISTVTCFKQN